MKIFLSSQTYAEGIVDAESGRIEGVSLISTPEAKGHNISIDRKSIESFYEAVEGKTIKAYYTHSPANDALDSIGLWSNFRIVEEGEYTKLLGDFEALEAWRQNDTKEYQMLFELASKAPEAFGVSAEFSARAIVYEEDGKEKDYDADQDANMEVFARAVEVSAFSIVAQPAANPTGLFAEQKEDTKVLAEQAEKKSEMEMELRQTKEAISIVEKANKELEVKLSESSEEKQKLETELKEWQCKYAKAIADMGADPVDAQVEEAPKTFQERLDACKTYSEKHKFLNENMAELQQNWNKLI